MRDPPPVRFTSKGPPTDNCWTCVAAASSATSSHVATDGQVQPHGPHREGLADRRSDHRADRPRARIGTHALTAEQWYYGLLDTIDSTWGAHTDLFTWWQQRVQLPLVQRFTQWFDAVLLREVDQRIVVCVEEIDWTLRLGFTDDFFAPGAGVRKAGAVRNLPRGTQGAQGRMRRSICHPQPVAVGGHRETPRQRPAGSKRDLSASV